MGPRIPNMTIPNMVNGHLLQNGAPQMNGHIPNPRLAPQQLPGMMMHNPNDDRPIETISKRIAYGQNQEPSPPYANGLQHMGNGVANGVANHVGNGVSHMGNVKNSPVVRAPAMGNGFVGNPNYYTDLDAQRRENIRNNYGEVNSHM